MKKIIILVLAVTVYSCTTTKEERRAKAHVCKTTAHETCDGSCECDGLGCPKIDTTTIVIYPTMNIVDGRQTFSVIIGKDYAMDYMYPEEIAEALKTGIWEYNEDLRVK